VEPITREQLIPRRLPDTELTLGRCVGVGGTAAVYEAHHPRMGRVAVKRAHPDAPPGLLAREARGLGRVRHPGVPALLEEAPGHLVLEHLEGETLFEARQRLGFRRSLAVVAQLLDTLAAVHESGVVHCDVKPSNVVVGERSWLIDFGICSDVGTSSMNETGVVAGTPAYMAPEQLVGGAVSAATDVYALGALLYWLWAGEVPFSGLTADLLRDKREGCFPPATLFGATPNETLDALLGRMLAPEPADRPPLAEVRVLLEQVRLELAGATEATSPTAAIVDEPTALLSAA